MHYSSHSAVAILPRGVDTNECECVWGGRRGLAIICMVCVSMHELALFILICIMIQSEAKNWGRGLSPQSPIGVYTLAPNCACAHKIGYVCVLVHITECARWSTEQVEYRTACCNAFLLYSAQNGLCNFYWLCFSCATYHITDVQKHMGTHWNVYWDVKSHFPLLIVITFGNAMCTHILSCRLVQKFFSQLKNIEPSAQVETCQRCLINTGSQD